MAVVIDAAFAHRFAAEWVSAWNAHDLQAVLAHYTEDFAMTSPIIQSLMSEPTGTLQGKAAVADYWRKALQKVPNLKFTLITVLLGVQSVALYYKGANDKLVVEVFHFDSHGLVDRASSHYDAPCI